MTKTKRELIALRRLLMEEAFEREGGKCFWCSREMDLADRALIAIKADGYDVAPTLDHLIPKSRGGQDVIENVVCSCRRCNQARGNTPADLFLHAAVAGAL